MQIELVCRYYAKGWLSFGHAVHLVALEHFAFAGELAERDIPRNYTVQGALEDLSRLPDLPNQLWSLDLTSESVCCRLVPQDIPVSIRLETV